LRAGKSAPGSLHLQRICSEMPPLAAETLGFPGCQAANLQRICSKNPQQMSNASAEYSRDTTVLIA